MTDQKVTQREIPITSDVITFILVAMTTTAVVIVKLDR